MRHDDEKEWWFQLDRDRCRADHLEDMPLTEVLDTFKRQLKQARINPSPDNIAEVVYGYGVFNRRLSRERPLDQMLFTAYIRRLLPAEWPLWECWAAGSESGDEAVASVEVMS